MPFFVIARINVIARRREIPRSARDGLSNPELDAHTPGLPRRPAERLATTPPFRHCEGIAMPEAIQSDGTDSAKSTRSGLPRSLRSLAMTE